MGPKPEHFAQTCLQDILVRGTGCPFFSLAAPTFEVVVFPTYGSDPQFCKQRYKIVKTLDKIMKNHPR